MILSLPVESKVKNGYVLLKTGIRSLNRVLRCEDFILIFVYWEFWHYWLSL